MAKTKNQNHSETRHKDGRIKELEKQVRQLTRQLRYFEKRNHLADSVIESKDEIVVVEITTKNQIPCLECNKGFYFEMFLGDKIYGRCETCGHNKRLK